MNLHFKTLIYLVAFISIAILVALSMQHFPIFTGTAVAIFMFIAFYNIVYCFLKMEQTLDQIKDK